MRSGLHNRGGTSGLPDSTIQSEPLISSPVIRSHHSPFVVPTLWAPFPWRQMHMALPNMCPLSRATRQGTPRQSLRISSLVSPCKQLPLLLPSSWSKCHDLTQRRVFLSAPSTHSLPASVLSTQVLFPSQLGIPASLASAVFVEALSSGHHCLLGLAYICGTPPSGLQLKVSLYPWPQLSLRDSSLPSLPNLDS